MDKICTIEDMTVDASVHGSVIEVENYDGSTKLIAGRYGGIISDQIFCGNCGAYLDLGGYNDIDEVVKQHLKEMENALSN